MDATPPSTPVTPGDGPAGTLTPPPGPITDRHRRLHATTPAAVLAMPAPADAAGLALRARVLDAHARRAWDELADLLANTRPLPLRARLTAVWLPLATVLAGSSTAAERDDVREVEAAIRADVRMALAAFEEIQPELWLVPGAPVDETAAYLGALVLAMRGHPARPWIWRVPPPGLAVVVSIGPAAPPGDQVPQRHPGTFGTTTLAELCRQNGFGPG
jgi:hypothetical protein